jgi:hypothetical protein
MVCMYLCRVQHVNLSPCAKSKCVWLALVDIHPYGFILVLCFKIRHRFSEATSFLCVLKKESAGQEAASLGQRMRIGRESC